MSGGPPPSDHSDEPLAKACLVVVTIAVVVAITVVVVGSCYR